jgi:FdrA protein
VGAITFLQALDVLARDPETKVIVLTSKPPSPKVAEEVLKVARKAGKPVVVNFMPAPSPLPAMVICSLPPGWMMPPDWQWNWRTILPN